MMDKGEDSERISVWEDDPGEKLLTVNRLEGPLELTGWDYGGIYYKNTFRVDHPIILRTVSFYGPAIAEVGSYEFEVVLESFYGGHRLGSNSGIVGSVTQGQIFEVNFRKPIELTKDRWYTIKFQLDGPPTLRAEDIGRRTRVVHPEGITFEFFIGSNQMPLISFNRAYTG